MFDICKSVEADPRALLNILLLMGNECDSHLRRRIDDGRCLSSLFAD